MPAAFDGLVQSWWEAMNTHTVTSAKRGRKPGSRNKASRFDHDRCMDILHEVSARAENESLTVYQILDVAAREIINMMLERKPNDEQLREANIKSVRKQLERAQAENDNNYFHIYSDAEENYHAEWEVIRNQDPNDGPESPPPTPWEEVAERDYIRSEADLRILRQGFIHSAMKANFVVIEKRHPVKKRKLK